jgi:hypothetical protein
MDVHVDWCRGYEASRGRRTVACKKCMFWIDFLRTDIGAVIMLPAEQSFSKDLLAGTVLPSTWCPESPRPLPSRCARLFTEILISSNIKRNSGKQTVITDFPKENYGVMQALINSDSLRSPLVTIDGEKGTKICPSVFRAEKMGIKKINQKLMSTLGDSDSGLSQIKILLQRFRTRDLSCSNRPRAGRSLLTLGRQVDAFLQKYFSQAPT